MVFVASPKAIGKTPVASGSNVPACPTFFALKAHLILVTTPVDVMPAGLSIIIQPFILLPLRFETLDAHVPNFFFDMTKSILPYFVHSGVY